MMLGKGDLKDLVSAFLSVQVDPLLQSTDFRRRKGSIRYLRKHGSVTCAIEFNISVRPRYAAPDSQLSLDYVMIAPDVMDLARKISSHGVGEGEVIHRQSLYILLPPGIPMWKFRDQASLMQHSASIVKGVRDYIIPYAASLESLDDYVDSRLEMFSRVEESRSPEIFVLSAAILLSSKEDEAARHLLRRFIDPPEADRIFNSGLRILMRLREADTAGGDGYVAGVLGASACGRRPR